MVPGVNYADSGPSHGERMLAMQLQSAALREAQLVNTVGALESEVYHLRARLDEITGVLTDKQREKLLVGAE